MTDTAHRETHFENYVISKPQAQGWKVGHTDRYDTERALYPKDLETWLQASQPKVWDKLVKDHGERALEHLMNQVARALEAPKKGTIHVLPFNDGQRGHARETARVILAAWIGAKANGNDLGGLIKQIPEDRSVLKSAAHIVNRLHPRGKSAERESQESKGVNLREPTDEDAETSVHLVGMMLREIGWAAA